MKVISPLSPSTPIQPGQIVPESTGRDLVPVPKGPPPVIHGGRKDAMVDQGGGKDIRVNALNMRHISPRQISQTGQDLYTIGAIGWDEYEMLAFQPELHPDFDLTIGALIGDTADADRPRDYIEIWEKRLRFERRYNPDQIRQIRQAEHLVSILRQIDNPTNLVA